jgi:hypothetical protein
LKKLGVSTMAAREFKVSQNDGCMPGRTRVCQNQTSAIKDPAALCGDAYVDVAGFLNVAIILAAHPGLQPEKAHSNKAEKGQKRKTDEKYARSHDSPQHDDTAKAARFVFLARNYFSEFVKGG